MTTVAPFLDDMTAFAESRADFLRYAEIFPLDSHSVESDRVTALSKIGQLLLVTLSAFFRKDHGLLFGGCLMIDVAGDAVNTLPCMLGFNP